MGAGISIPINFTDTSGEQQLARVRDGIWRIKQATDEVAKSTKKLTQERQAANRVGGASARPKADPRAVATLDAVRAFAPQLGASGSAVGRFAGAGLKMGGGGMAGLAAGAGIGAAVVAGAMIFKAVERLDESFAEVVRRAHAIRDKSQEAAKSLGQQGVASIGSQGLGIQRALSEGYSLDDIKSHMSRGLSPENLARIGKNPMAVRAAIVAQRFGVSANDAAGEIAGRGGVRGDDAVAIAASLAGSIQKRRIGKDAIARARGQTDFGKAFDEVQHLQGRISGVGIDAVTSGRAVATAQESLSRASDPVQAVLMDEYRNALKQTEVLQEIADGQSWFTASIQEILHVVSLGSMNDGSSRRRADKFSEETGRAFERAAGAAQ